MISLDHPFFKALPAPLNQVIYQNPLWHWALSAMVAVGVYLIVCLLLLILRRVLKRWGFYGIFNPLRWLNLLVTHTHHFFLWAIAIQMGAVGLTIKEPEIRFFIEILPMLAWAVQFGIWAQQGINLLWEHLVSSRSTETERLVTRTMVGPVQVVTKAGLWVIVFLLVLDNLGFNITTLVAGLGIGGVAVALAVQSILGDLLASFSIVLDKPFVMGDFIIFKEFMGTVERIGARSTQLRSLSGEQIIVPNSDLLKTVVSNYKRMEERRIAFQFNVMYETPLDKLQQIPELVKQTVESIEKTRFDRANWLHYGNWGLTFEVVYFVLDPDYNLYVEIQEQINQKIREHLDTLEVVLAYPARGGMPLAL